MIFHGDYGDVPDAEVDGFVDGQEARRAKFKLRQNRPVKTPRQIIIEPRKRGRPLDGRAAGALEWSLSTDDGATRAPAPSAQTRGIQ